MTAQLIVDRDSGRTFVLFAVSGVDDEFVSVVGSFNGWVPGVHILHPQSDGTRTAFVEVEHPGDVHFRYLGSGSRWFDDPTADVVNEHGSTLLRGDAPAPAAPVKAVAVPVVTTSDAPAKKAPVKKAPAKKVAKKTAAAAEEAPATTAAAKKTPAKKSAARKTAAEKTAAEKTAAKKTPAAKKAAKKATKKSSSA